MLISLALNLMQEQVMSKVHWVAREIGMTGDGNTNEEVVKITKEDRYHDGFNISCVLSVFTYLNPVFKAEADPLGHDRQRAGLQREAEPKVRGEGGRAG